MEYLQKIHEKMNGSTLAISLSIDGTKAVKGTQISHRYSAILSDAHPQHFVNITDKSDDDISTYFKRCNSVEDDKYCVAEEVKIAVIRLQVTHPRTSPYIILAGRSHTLNENNYFIDVIVKGCTNSCSELDNCVLLSVATDGVSCESV